MFKAEILVTVRNFKGTHTEKWGLMTVLLAGAIQKINLDHKLVY
jgi:hypothetical protein